MNLGLIGKIALVLFALTASPAFANPGDSAYIKAQITKSDCAFDVEAFTQTFSGAMDRLQEINPKLALYIRTVNYHKPFTIKCDVPETENAIYFSPEDQSIHLWKSKSYNWRTVANFFHEYLHFAGVKIDIEYHNKPDAKNILEVDPVYACHFAVFTDLFPLIPLDPARIPAARAECATAEVE